MPNIIFRYECIFNPYDEYYVEGTRFFASYEGAKKHLLQEYPEAEGHLEERQTRDGAVEAQYKINSCEIVEIRAFILYP